MQSKTFLYREIYESLREAILSGQFAAEDKLPTEDELAQRYSVSKITVKKALDLLKEDGLILRVQGRGTFVRRVEPLSEERDAKERSRLIGLVLEHVSSAFGLNMMYYIGRRLDAAGYKLCTRFTFGSIEKETEEIHNLLEMNVAGMIIMPCHDSHYNITILKLILENFPIVLVDKRMHGLPISSVCTDGKEAMRQLVHHLKQRGCENAALLSVDPASTTSLGDRAEGFYKGLEETQMRCAGERIMRRRTGDMISSEPEPQYVTEIGEYLDSMERLPDALVCSEYAIGRALYSAAHARGLEPGVDFKACCMDEDENAMRGAYFTHMRQDEAGLAEETVHILLELLNGAAGRQTEVRVPAIFRMGRTT